MKTFAVNGKLSAPRARKARPYIHYPVGLTQLAQHAAMRKILRPNETRLEQDNSENKNERQCGPAVAGFPVTDSADIPSGGAGLKTSIQRSENEAAEEELQRQSEEEEEPAQAKLIQRQAENEEEEEQAQAQAKLVQRQADNEEEEESVQAKRIQRQAEHEEDEEPVRAKLIQLHITGNSSTALSKIGYISPKQKAQQAEVRNILRTSDSQAKLTLGQPNDKYEQEADRIADQVIARPDPRSDTKLQRNTENNDEETVQSKPLFDQITPVVQRQQAPEEEEPVQTKGEESGSLSIGFQEQLSKGSGHPLSESTRASMEPQFGTDLSEVRVHTDSSATRMNKEVGAQAFTHGSDIYFNEGKYNPVSTAGKHLLAHELTHTIQQGGVVRKKPLSISSTTPSIQRLSLKGILNKVANYIPGYSLITVILGKNPITGDPVPRTGKNILKGVLGLIPVFGNIWFNNLQKTGAAEKAGLWLDKEIEKLNITWSGIKALISRAWDEMSIWKGITGNIKVMKNIFGPVWGRVKRFLSAIGSKIKEFILDGALALAGSAGKQVKGIMNKGKKIFMKILDDPLAFVKNFLKAIGLGFSQFGRNILLHLKTALFEWMFGAFSKAGIELPKSFDIKSIFGFILQIFGLTYANIRAKLVKKLGSKGEKIVSVIEKSVGFVKELIIKGPIALWAKVKESLSNLKQMIFEEVNSWLITTIIKKALFKLATMFNPVGALIQAALAIYNTVMFFIERWNQIKEVISAIFSAIGPIVFGQLAKAANFIEKTLGKGLTLVISFLARFIGLGGIVQKIKNIIDKIRKPVDKALNKVIGWLVKKGRALFSKGIGALKKGAGKVKDTALSALFWWKKKKKLQTADGESHTVYFQGEGKSAKLMISTTPMEYTDYVKDLISTQGLDKNDNKVRAALALADNIDTKKAQVVPASKEEQKTKDIVALVDKLVEATKDLPLQGGSPNNTPPAYGPLRNGWGTFARVKYMQSEHSMGSVPKVTNDRNFEYINIRRKDSGSLYVKGHLLNDNLGGPGTTWKNLTPITGAANSDHKVNFEKVPKIAVNATEARISQSPKAPTDKNKPPGAMQDFSCVATYGRSLPASYTILNDLESEAYPDGWNDHWDRETVLNILKAEQFVPLTIVCSVHYKNKLAEEWKNHPYTVQNDIQYGNLNHYQLVAKPKTTFKFASKILWSKPTYEEKMAEVLKLTQIGEKRAKDIYNRFESHGGIHSFKAVTGITLKALEKWNPEYKFKLGTKP